MALGTLQVQYIAHLEVRIQLWNKPTFTKYYFLQEFRIPVIITLMIIIINLQIIVSAFIYNFYILYKKLFYKTGHLLRTHASHFHWGWQSGG